MILMGYSTKDILCEHHYKEFCSLSSNKTMERVQNIHQTSLKDELIHT